MPSPHHLPSRRPEDLTFEVVGAVGLMGALVALIALTQRFGGSRTGDRDRQEGAQRRRRG
jgi:hypothetical protein